MPPRIIQQAQTHEDESIQRFLRHLNENREFIAEDYSNHPKDKPQRFLFSNNILHPLILRRLAKRSNEQLANNEGEFLLNDDIYDLDSIIDSIESAGLVQNGGNKRSATRLLNNVRWNNGGLYG